ncbi:hypothetical protein F0231_03110 [Vibrio sp. RE86]|uniref:hypothetical protein n=1 Tax=Vibrio sp. RE86 TaxID=2607605 RepID=UPI001493AC52|nr:hypothetical protein [Vibrio sp. RE86]NOH78725.1 hypothetical protein [Vibrio sp. RE86]
MARISREERQRKLEQLNDGIWQLFLEQGYDALTFYNIAHYVNWRQSTIQSYHKSETLVTAIRGRIEPYFLGKLNFDSLCSLEQSWVESLEDNGFVNIIRFLINLNCSDPFMVDLTGYGVRRLEEVVAQSLGDDGLVLLQKLMGLSVMKIAKERSSPKSDPKS